MMTVNGTRKKVAGWDTTGRCRIFTLATLESKNKGNKHVYTKTAKKSIQRVAYVDLRQRQAKQSSGYVPGRYGWC